jgi:hypothetical protein
MLCGRVPPPAADAHRLVEARQAIGEIVLVP